MKMVTRLKTAYRVLRGKEDVQENNTVLQLENSSLRAKTYRLEEEIERLRGAFADRQNIDLAGFINDGEPSNPKQRAKYVAEVSYFFDEILDKRLRASIAHVREQLARMQYDGVPSYVPREHYDWFLRGTENALWLVYEWGKNMSSEHINNMNTGLEDNDNT